MKNIKIYMLAMLLAIVSSCDFGDTNVAPERPLDVGMAAIMPALQTGISFAVGGEITLFSNIMTQHIKGGSTAQQGDFTRYNIVGQDMDGSWQNMYTNGLNMAHVIITKANDASAPHYSGMAKVIMAYGLGVVTDMWGDAPYSEAFRFDQGIIAGFDSQQDIYGDIQTLLDEAIVELGATSSSASPAGDDLIYGGNLSKWILAARSLKAKYYLHLSKVDANAYQNALDAISAGAIASESDNMQQLFAAGANNPRQEFDINRAGNIFMGDYFVNTMTANADPRLGQLNSINAGYYTSAASPVPYVTSGELKLIEAEALLFTGGALADVRTALLDGSNANIQSVTGGTDASAYLAALGARFDAATTDTDRQRVIIEEKYIVTYSTGIEGWNDYRRTGFPVLTPDPDGDRSTNPGGAIPRRMPWPENERLLNTNIPFTEVNMQLRFWWDN